MDQNIIQKALISIIERPNSKKGYELLRNCYKMYKKHDKFLILSNFIDEKFKNTYPSEKE